MIATEVARAVRLVVLDADGVLTDGAIEVAAAPDGAVLDIRRFHVLDGLGIHLMRRAGLEVAIVSGKDSAAVRARARELRIEEVHQVSPRGKIAAVQGILSRRGWSWAAVAHLADDLADIGLLERAALPAAVANAVPEVLARADWHGSVPGGSGAVREFAEALLRARGDWEGVLRDYVAWTAAAPTEGEDGERGEE